MIMKIEIYSLLAHMYVASSSRDNFIIDLTNIFEKLTIGPNKLAAPFILKTYWNQK